MAEILPDSGKNELISKEKLCKVEIVRRNHPMPVKP